MTSILLNILTQIQKESQVINRAPLISQKNILYKLSMEVEVNSHMSARGFLQTCLLVLLHVWLALERRRRRARAAGVS